MENQRYENTSYVWRNCSPRDYPPDYEHLLLCNGQAINVDDYPELVAALGTNVLPNLNGRVLQGAETAGEYKEAGLPNIDGNISSSWGSFIWQQNSGVGAFKHKPDSQRKYNNVYDNSVAQAPTAAAGLVLNASLSNPIYGASDTVQPPAYTVRYYICYG